MSKRNRDPAATKRGSSIIDSIRKDIDAVTAESKAVKYNSGTREYLAELEEKHMPYGHYWARVDGEMVRTKHRHGQTMEATEAVQANAVVARYRTRVEN